ncbi:MAG: hypothetical protein WC238_02925 [Parcubacteria group bacterium]|jgi:hypothetical protein
MAISKEGFRKFGNILDQAADYVGVLGGIPQFVKTFKQVFGGQKPQTTQAEKTAERAGEEFSTEETPTPEVHLGGMLSYADEVGFAKLLAELGNKYTIAPEQISLWIEKNLSKDEGRRFRVILSLTGKLSVEKAGKIFKKSSFEKIFTKKGLAPNIEKGTTEGREILKENFGIAFLKNFWKSSPEGRHALCYSIGVFDSPMEDLLKDLKRIDTWAKRKSKVLVRSIDELTAELKTTARPVAPKRPYRGFFKELFSFTK